MMGLRLSNEVKAKFKEIKPKTMGQALRIDGITPAAVYILLSHVKRKSISIQLNGSRNFKFLL